MGMTKLERAIVFLGAAQVAPAAPCTHLAQCQDANDCAFVRRFAYYYAPREAWQVVGRASLMSLAGVKEHDPGEWEAISAKTMPPWWTPQKPIAWRVRGEQLGSDAETVTSLEVAIARERASWTVERITVDLETGAEVAA
jgi:hypothetical protein